jgi:hypothetical protein
MVERAVLASEVTETFWVALMVRPAKGTVTRARTIRKISIRNMYSADACPLLSITPHINV